MSLRIEFVTEGGFAAIPGFAKPVRIDCATLPPLRSRRIEALVRGADFFSRPVADAGSPVPDGRTYTIGVDDGARCRTLSVNEPIADEAMRNLVAELRLCARQLRSAEKR